MIKVDTNEFFLDPNRAAFAPRYLLFELLVNGEPKFGQFTIAYMADPFYKTTHLTLENFGSLSRYRSGSAWETLEKIPIEQIKILSIVDGRSTKEQSPLSLFIETVNKIFSIDTSFDRYDVKETTLTLLDKLSDVALDYGSEHPTSNYKTIIAFVDQKRPELEKLDGQYTDNEATNRQIMRDTIDSLKEEVRRWAIDLLFMSPQN